MLDRGPSDDSQRPARLWPALLSVLVASATLAVVVGGGVGGVPGASASHGPEGDFAPPQVTDVERVDTDTVGLVLADNHDVDEATIDQNDFEVTPGTITGVEATDSGTNADVTLSIEGAGNRAVTISSTDETAIEDVNGNEFDPTEQFNAAVEEPQDLPRLDGASFADAARARDYQDTIEWPSDKPGETTTVELSLTDGQGIRSESIDVNDFFVSRSQIADVAVKTDGQTARVLLVLADNLDDGGMDEGQLTVGIAEEADIRDTVGRVGNRIARTSQSVTLRNTSPRLTEGYRVNETAVAVSFVDDSQMALSSFQAHDFQIAGADLQGKEVSDFQLGNVDPRTLQEYDITGVEVEQNDQNTTVVLGLIRPVDDEELLVRVRPDAQITDTIGNRFEPANPEVKNRVLVEGMDGVAPELEDISLTKVDADTVTLSIVPSERLDGIDVEVTEPSPDSLDRSDFRFDDAEFRYETTYETNASEGVAVRLRGLTDEAGNTRQFDRILGTNGSSVRPRPKPVIALDFEASTERTLVFDGRHSSGPNRITNYTWEFGDGTTEYGLRASKQFGEGQNLVALTVTDVAGRSATDTARLDLSATSPESLTAAKLDGVRRLAEPDLTVTRLGDDSVRVAIEDPSPGVPVSASQRLQTGETLAGGEAASLDDVTVVPAGYADLELEFSPTDPGSGADFLAGTDTERLGGFAVEHDAPDSAFQQVNLSTSVDATRLAESGATPENVSLYRRSDGNWQRLPTESVGPTDQADSYRLQTQSPGFSRFAVVANTTGPVSQNDTAETSSNDSTAGPDVVVENATLNRSTVEPGTTVRVNATLSNRGGANDIFLAGVTVNGTVRATESVTMPAGESRTVSLTFVPSETGTYPVAVNGTSAGDLAVGGDGGLIAPVLSLFQPLLGLLPLGLLKPLLLFVGLPVVFVYAILKVLAIYLGY